jgi:hypothetical protein
MPAPWDLGLGTWDLGFGIWDLGFAQTQVVARRGEERRRNHLQRRRAVMMQWKQADSTPGDPWTLSQGDARMRKQGGGGEQSRRMRLQRAETRRRKGGGGRQLVERCTADVCDGLARPGIASPGESTSDRLRKTLAAV